MQVPKDQGLFFTVFFSFFVVVILVAWVLMPAYRHHGEEEAGKNMTREQAVLQAELVIEKANELLTKLEKKAEADQKKKDKKKTK